MDMKKYERLRDRAEIMMPMFLLGVNVFYLLTAIAFASLVDGNGRILGLSAAISYTVRFVVFAPAFAVAAVLIVKGWRLESWWMISLGALLMHLYAILLGWDLGGP